MKLIIMGFGEPLKLVYDAVRSNFEVIGVIKDFERKSSENQYFDNFLNMHNIPKLNVTDIGVLRPDLVLSINYVKIIDTSCLDGLVGLNIHMGLLPKYRGTNANAWALINGENKVGYTLHELTPELDGGDIYYKYEYEIHDGETYSDAKKFMNTDITNNISVVLKGILNKTIIKKSQKGSHFVYCSKILPEDGIIKNWNVSTDSLINMFRIFSKPLGTGLKLIFKKNTYEIVGISKIEKFAISKGIPGAVVMKNSNGAVWIKTSDTAISINALILNGQELIPSSIFNFGDRL